MATGEYTEMLPCGGKLNVKRVKWEITYYFPGRDRRHNGDFIHIPANQVPKYIKAYAKNWNEYQALKKTIPLGGDYSTEGEMGMTIRLGKYGRGVCIKSYHMPLDTKEAVLKVINSYKYALKRAPQIQEFLSEL